MISSTCQTSKNAAALDDNVLVSYRRDPATGKLGKDAIRVKTGARVPRHFNLDGTGLLIAVAHQGGDEVTIFERDAKTGAAMRLTNGTVQNAAYAVWREQK